MRDVTRAPLRPAHNHANPDPFELVQVLYVKHMAKQRLGIDKTLIRSGKHVLLVR